MNDYIKKTTEKYDQTTRWQQRNVPNLTSLQNKGDGLR